MTDRLAFALDAITEPVSLSEPVYADSGESVSVMDQIRDNSETPESWLERMALSDALAALGEREKRILAMRYYDKCYTRSLHKEGRPFVECAVSEDDPEATAALLVERFGSLADPFGGER